MKRAKKVAVLLLPVTLISITGCKKKETNSRKKYNLDDLVDVDESVTAKTLDDEKLGLFPGIFVKKLSQHSTFKSVTKGETIATVVGVNVNQTIDCSTIRSDYSYLINESHSSMVNTTHVAYFHSGKVLYKNDKKDYSLDTLDSYLSKYGTYPFDLAIEGYSIDKDSIKSVTRMESSSDYKFKVVMDKDKATNNIKIQMKAFGGLDENPVFLEDSVMEITVKEDFTPVKIDLSAHYEAKKFLKSECKQKYTVTYSLIDQPVQVPDLDNIKSKFN